MSIQISRTRDGTMTRIVVTCANEAQAARAAAALRSATSYDASRDGLTFSLRCARRDADRVMAALAAIPADASVAQAMPLPARQWRHRVMRLAGSPIPPEEVIVVAGETLRFSGYGAPFITNSEMADPDLQGVPVRYAYYA